MRRAAVTEPVSHDAMWAALMTTMRLAACRVEVDRSFRPHPTPGQRYAGCCRRLGQLLALAVERLERGGHARRVSAGSITAST